jgi:hypothetical protein
MAGPGILTGGDRLPPRVLKKDRQGSSEAALSVLAMKRQSLLVELLQDLSVGGGYPDK